MGQESADVSNVCQDCYLRAGDWTLVEKEDVVGTENDVAIKLGVAERGESTKTGTRQCVRPDFPEVRRILLEKRRRARPGQKIFRATAGQVRKDWNLAGEKLGFRSGPTHTLRHIGPSEDALSGYRTIKEIRVRGRWRALTSVLRYGKSFSLIEAKGNLPERVRMRGEARMSKLGSRAAKAIM